MPPAPPTSAEILSYFQKRRQRLAAEIAELSHIETPTGDADGIRRFVRRYRCLLEEGHVACREIDGPAGPHIWGQSPGREPAIAFVGHADTVWPRGEVEKRPPEVRNGRLHGPGVFDMKGGLCLVAAVLRFLAEHGIALKRRLQVFVAADEEEGSVTAHPHMEALLAPAATAIVPEPPCPDGAMKVSRKGVAVYEIRVRGREAHAGAEPEKGVSAIVELARLVLELGGWNDRDRGVTVNVGTLGGGTATNVVAGEAWCGVDVRFEQPEDGTEIDRRLRTLEASHPQASVDLSGGIIFPPMVPSARTLQLSGLVEALAREVGLEVGSGASGGGSDGSFLAARGLTVLDGLGPDGGGAHALDEHVVVDRLPLRAALLTRLVLELDRLEE